MTRAEAIQKAKKQIKSSWINNLIKSEQWGKLADYVLKKTQDTTLSDAIFSG